MSYAAAETNITVVHPYYATAVENVITAVITSVTSCVFLYINGVLLFTLRSKPIFCETSRYILLFNLLFADTVQMALSQLLYLLSVLRILLTYPLCGFLVMLASLTNNISPLTLLVMSLERYVAVCYPLRHSTIINVCSTAGAIAVIWALSSLNVFVRISLLLQFPFEDLKSLEMTQTCSVFVLYLMPVVIQYDKAYTSFLFVSAFVTIASSYIGVTLTARSASTDKASSLKVRNTLLLHLVQLGLNLLSTIHNIMLIAIYNFFDIVVFQHVQTTFYVSIILLPKCLSSLIYGLRDQTIRLLFMYHICCKNIAAPQPQGF
ncbi:odorant receptor 131-2-like [Sphaeramia orbicularis]|uniref:odorant receptor 131-2-like n=1 Tax=Sphaeramia orbicularis TaxID=375764 RepID=UPI00117D60A3|nr:odorant receptor 131-2-like [Sphaeramia orbicularis]